MSDQGKKAFGKQWQSNGLTNGFLGQQWQADAGTKAGKPPKGKGKVAANQQWQQAGNAKGWGNNQGSANGSQGTGWQADGGMRVQAQAFFLSTVLGAVSNGAGSRGWRSHSTSLINW